LAPHSHKARAGSYSLRLIPSHSRNNPSPRTPNLRDVTRICSTPAEVFAAMMNG
jgi:hypothetical protein